MRYEIKALNEGEDVLALSLEAPDEQEAVRQAEAQGYTVLAVKARRGLPAWRSGSAPRLQLAQLSQELITLLDAGLTLVEAVETLVERERRRGNNKMLLQVINDLYEGRPLSYALQRFPETFPMLFVATVRASEKTGDMSEALGRYVAYHLQMDTVRKKVVSASIYPLLLLVVGGAVTLFLMAYVVPKFSRIYEDLGGDLPLLTRLLMDWGNLLETHGAVIFTAFGAALAALLYGATRPEFRRWVSRKIWELPKVGDKMKTYQLARFYRTLGMLLRGGTPILAALQMVSGLLQPTLRAKLELAGDAIHEGLSISQAMERHGLTTPVSLRMLRVGERTGRMGEMMERIAGFYEDETARWVDWFTKLFEPLLMASMGLIIGLIVILMYFPIFELAGSIQ
jgi:general secretion pathway protein F